jgi:alpha-glucosidase (family GH31 glycosyl hydrolase)
LEVSTVTTAPFDVLICAPGIVRLRIGGEKSDGASYLSRREWPSTEIAATGRVDTGRLHLRIGESPSALELCDKAGRPVLRLAGADITLDPAPALRIGVEGAQHFYGLGEGSQQFDRLGATRRFWNSEANHGPGADLSIPLLLSSLGYALFFDNATRAEIVVGDSIGGAGIEYRWAAGRLDLYMLGGDDLRATMGDIAELLGHARLLPRWALGFMQSTRHFDNAEELLALPARMRSKRLPCDAIILLSTYGKALGWNRGVGHLEFEANIVPHPAGLTDALHQNGFRLITHEYPVVHRDSPICGEAVTRASLLDHAYPDQSAVVPDNYRQGQRFIDFSKPSAGAWWWGAHRALVEIGVDGWWLDGGEGPPAATPGAGPELHNRYDLLRQQAFFEGEARDRPDRRAFMLCRSGGPGMQRFGAACWSGDIDCSFPTLEAQIAIGLNMGLSGVPYWGTDIGGFYQIAPPNAELFVRWFQFGTFCPVFRAHGHAWRQHLPWSYGDEVEAICRRYLELRYRLLPYTYTLARQAYDRGLPLMRPLVLNYPDDPKVWQLGTQYLWGDDLLVAPVTREGATHWPVYLPEGRWHDFWTHECHDGRRGITVAAPLERLPLFVRSGAILPLGPAKQQDGEDVPEAYVVMVFPDGRSRFELYDDDGRSNAYDRGGYAVTELACDATEVGLTLCIGSPRGDTTAIGTTRRYLWKVFAPHPPRSVLLSGVGPLPRRTGADESGWHYDAEGWLFVPGGRLPSRIEIAW